ncbi:MAG: hotdog domain-containing protein [Sphingobium sp.]
MTRSFTAMPLLADRLRLQQACPYWRVLGIDLLEWGRGRAVMRMAPSPRIAAGTDDARIDPLALVGMLDDSFSNAMATVLPLSIGISTLDLRMEFASAAPPTGAVTAETQVQLVGDTMITAHIMAHDEAGPIATGTSMFTLGGYPGGSLPDFGKIGLYDPVQATGPFRALIGLERAGDDAVLPGGNPNVIGWEGGPALHGGVIGAVLMESCLLRAAAEGEIAAGKRLASLYLRYLRPGSALQTLRASSTVDRLGRSASFLSARCFHDDGRDVGHAHAIFVPDEAAAA